MKKIINILMLLMCVCLVSCDDDSDATVELKVLEREMDITPAGGTLTATLTVDGDAVISDQSWCAASISGNIVTVTLEPNEKLEGRTAMITVTKDKQSVSFAVTQPGNLFPDAGVGTITFDAHGGTETLDVYHGMSFTAVSADPWLTVQVNGSQLILSTQKNYTINTLRTKVKLTSAGLESELIVTQSGLTLTPEKQNVTMFNGGDEATIKVKSTLSFTATSDADWLTVVSGEDFVTLTATDNTDQPLRTAKVTLSSETLTATINVTQRPPIYSDYLGSWTLTGIDNGSKFTYDLTIEQSKANSTYKVTGWGKSGVANNSDYAIQANFDAKSGLIFITGQEDIGIYDNQYRIMFYGQVEIGGKFYFLNGTDYFCYIGALQQDGSVQWMNGYDPINGFEVVGGMYMLVSLVDEEDIVSFTVDSPFMREPTMVKNVSKSTRSILKRDDILQSVIKPWKK